MSKVRRKFDKEFKLAAVRMVTEDKLSRVEVARRLGVNPTQIRQWVQEIISEGPEQSFPGNGKLKPWEEEIRKLKQENRDLRMEREFLKKSAAYFASLKK